MAFVVISFTKAKTFRDENTRLCDDYTEFRQRIKKPEGFFRVHWCGSADCEAKLQGETKATIRCIPLDAQAEDGVCLVCGKPSQQRVIVAKAY